MKGNFIACTLLVAGAAFADLTVVDGPNGKILCGTIVTQVGNVTDTVVQLLAQAVTPGGQIVVPGNELQVTWPAAGRVALLTMTGANTLLVTGKVKGRDAFPCRPEPVAGAVKIVRAQVGMSRNMLNTGIYCRHWDWAMMCSSSVSRSFLYDSTNGNYQYFSVNATGSPVKVSLIPSFYKENREGRVTEQYPITNDKLSYYFPWQYDVRPRVPVGWISWRAYGAGVTEANIRAITDFYANNNLQNFEFEYIVIDDGWFYGTNNSGFFQAPANVDWTRADPTKFPSGIKSLTDYVHGRGFKFGLWMSPYGFSGDPNQNPTWWVRNGTGGAFMTVSTGWHGRYYADATGPGLDNWLLAGTRAQVANGFDYLKLDGTMHVCYEGAYIGSANYFPNKGTTWQDAARLGYGAMRNALGPNRFYSISWSRIPVIAGLCDAMRVGGDMGAGTASWSSQAGLMYTWLYENNLVWIIDPDHMVMSGSSDAQFRLMSTITSMSGSLLLYSDAPSVYTAAKVEIVKRVTPQIGSPAPRSGDLFKKTGTTAALWTLEIDRPFDHWMIVANAAPAVAGVATLTFKDLGLDTTKSYMVYDFWNKSYKGVFSKTYACGTPTSWDVQLFSLREVRPYPWVISTSRHITQGGIDLTNVAWNGAARTLSGTSTVVANDPYMITLYLPTGATLVSATFGSSPATLGTNNGAATMAYTPAANGTVNWTATFNGISGVRDREVEAVFPYAPLQAVVARGILRLNGSYNLPYRIAVYDLSGRMLASFSGRGIINRKMAVRATGALLVRAESGGAAAVEQVIVSR